MTAFFSWSGGKDSMLALHRAQGSGCEVHSLLAMFDESGERSRSHATPPRLMFHTFVFDGPRFARPVQHELAAAHEIRMTSPAPGRCFVAELR
jgi:diphthamide synthase (EF-2-diphthine--ammonia ligase)